MSKSKSSCVPMAALFAIGVASYALFLRKRLLNWGAAGQAARQRLPGDHLVPAPNYQTNSGDPHSRRSKRCLAVDRANRIPARRVLQLRLARAASGAGGAFERGSDRRSVAGRPAG